MHWTLFLGENLGQAAAAIRELRQFHVFVCDLLLVGQMFLDILTIVTEARKYLRFSDLCISRRDSFFC